MNKPFVILLLIAIFTIPMRTEAQPPLIQARGQLTMLRVHDVGSAYGPEEDRIDVEVVFQLNTEDKVFGFQLRSDDKLYARQGMLDLLRDAYNRNWTVLTDYYRQPNKKHYEVWRVILVK